MTAKRPRSPNGTRRERISHTKTLVRKTVKGHVYLYWRWHERGRYRSRYVGKEQSEVQHEHEREL